MSAIAFYTADQPTALASASASASRWIETPQGLVLPAMAPRIAERLGVDVKLVLDVAAGRAILVDGELVSTEDERVLPQSEIAPDQRGGRALVGAGVDPGLILWRVPIFGAPLIVELAEQSLAPSPPRLERLLELGAPNVLVAVEMATQQGIVELLASHFTTGADPWRPNWSPIADELEAAAKSGDLSVPSRSVLQCFLYETRPPDPRHPLQVVLGGDGCIAVLYPYVALVLRLKGTKAVVEDAFCNFGHLAKWSAEGAIGFGAHMAPRANKRWFKEGHPSAPRYQPYIFFDAPGLVVDTLRGRHAAMSALGAPGGIEIRAITPDGKYCVLVRWLEEHRARMGHRHLIDMSTGEPQITGYESSLHRAKAISFCDGILNIAVGGKVICNGKCVAAYGVKDITAFDASGRLFARADAENVDLVDLATMSTRRIDLRPLHPLIRPTLRRSALLQGVILNGSGATPLLPETLDELRQNVTNGVWSVPAPGIDDATLQALLAERRGGWPELDVSS